MVVGWVIITITEHCAIEDVLFPIVLLYFTNVHGLWNFCVYLKNTCFIYQSNISWKYFKLLYIKCFEPEPEPLIVRPPSTFIMSLKIIVPKEWKVLPSITLQKELVSTIVAWQFAHKCSQGATGTYNGVTAELIENDYNWWFRKANDRNTKPDRKCYSVLKMYFWKKTLHTRGMVMKRRSTDKFVEPLCK